ncbi:MAG TPA: dihydroorotate dehydrogenase electron transfer subunit [Planctomycetota bacterium]|nr:dihydroorotate dehydrogenase electron transfer subunit [Planctomycetota bacterium]
MISSSGAGAVRSRVVFNRVVGPGWRVLRLEEPRIALAARSGRFVQILCRDEGTWDPLLRRPFSVYSVDRSAGTYDILYTAVGRGTRWMAEIPEAPTHAKETFVDVEGPFGNSFTPPGPGDRVILVGGGVGVAPLYLLAQEILTADGLARSAPRAGGAPSEVTLLMGARTRRQLQGIDDFRKLPIRAETATDDGSEGFHGRVTGLLERVLGLEADLARVRVYACGPQGMNEAVRALAVERSLWAEICLESLMACGFGVCFGCVLPIRKEPGGELYNRRTCWEGPVFDARLLHPGIEG